MRELVESIKKFYLEEGKGKASSPIEYGDNSRSTKLTKYNNYSEFEDPNKYSPEYSGATHTVDWANTKDKSRLNPSDRMKTIFDAKHLHHDFIDKSTQVGDVVKNIPVEDDDGGGNVRSRLYKKQGFGELGGHYKQHGIVKQHPDDHKDESMRGKKYLHPLEHKDIAAHDDNPSKGSSDENIRHISNSMGDMKLHQTKRRETVHNFMGGVDRYASQHQEYGKSNLDDLEKTYNAAKDKFTKPGDTLIRDLSRDEKESSFGKSTPTGRLRDVSIGHMLGFPAPKDYQQTGIVQKDSKYLKRTH